MDLTLLIDLWKDRPFLPHNTPPPPPQPPTLITGLHPGDYISMRRIKIRIEALQALPNPPIAWQPEKTAQPKFGDVTTN